MSFLPPYFQPLETTSAFPFAPKTPVASDKSICQTFKFNVFSEQIKLMFRYHSYHVLPVFIESFSRGLIMVCLSVSPRRSCSLFTSVHVILHKRTVAAWKAMWSQIFILGCLLCNLPLTTADSISCHSNDRQVHKRQFFFVQNTEQSERHSVHNACRDTETHCCPP